MRRYLLVAGLSSVVTLMAVFGLGGAELPVNGAMAIEGKQLVLTVLPKNASEAAQKELLGLVRPDRNMADASALLARLSIDKQISGDLQATTQGSMLSAGTAVKGSAAYVALERVTGTLHGKSGSFALMHVGTMNRGTPSLSITVVPDSGTGELEGLRAAGATR